MVTIIGWNCAIWGIAPATSADARAAADKGRRDGLCGYEGQGGDEECRKVEGELHFALHNEVYCEDLSCRCAVAHIDFYLSV
jgi:hypothetical protein